MKKEDVTLCKEETKAIETLPEKEEVEGYGVCDYSARKCQLDCIWPFPAHVFFYNG